MVMTSYLKIEKKTHLFLPTYNHSLESVNGYVFHLADVKKKNNFFCLNCF